MSLEEDLLRIADEYQPEQSGGTTDGDTFAIDADTFIQEDGTRIRIAGVDAPETGKLNAITGEVQPQEAGADIATEMLREMLANEDIEVTPTGDRSYNRQVAEVTADGREVGERLIERGVARPTMFSGQGQRTAEVTANLRNSGLFDDILSAEDLAINRQLAYEKEIKGFDPSYDRVLSGPSEARGTLSRSVSRGVDNTQGLLFAATNALGELTGLEGVAEWGDEGAERNMVEAALSPAEIGEFDNVKGLADFGTYVVEAIGEQLPNIALTATGAGLGAVAARAAIGKSMLSRMLANRGALAGAAATTYPLGVGEVQQELKGAGIDSPGTAFIAGLPIAALDAASFDIIFGNLFKGVKRGLAEDLVSGTARALGFTKDLIKGGLVGGLTEMPTETMQELIAITAHAYHDPEYEIFSDENLHRLRETAIKAGIVGTAGGGFSSAVQNIREQPLLISPEEPPVVVPPTDDVIAPSAMDSIPEDHITSFEGVDENGDTVSVEENTRDHIKTVYDEPINALERLAKCMGG